MRLPGRAPIHCAAELVDDAETRRRIIPRLFRSVGAPGFLGGADPWRSAPAHVLDVLANTPLVRLRPDGEPLRAGPDGPGGRRWILHQAALLALASEAVGAVAWLVRRRHRR